MTYPPYAPGAAPQPGWAPQQPVRRRGLKRTVAGILLMIVAAPAAFLIPLGVGANEAVKEALKTDSSTVVATPGESVQLEAGHSYVVERSNPAPTGTPAPVCTVVGPSGQVTLSKAGFGRSGADTIGYFTTEESGSHRVDCDPSSGLRVMTAEAPVKAVEAGVRGVMLGLLLAVPTFVLGLILFIVGVVALSRRTRPVAPVHTPPYR